MEERLITNAPVVPYATPVRGAPISSRDIFGVIIRVIGVLLAVWGFYMLAYFVGVQTISMSMGAQPMNSLLIVGGFYIAVGIGLIRGEWLVRFAYGRDRSSD